MYFSYVFSVALILIDYFISYHTFCALRHIIFYYSLICRLTRISRVNFISTTLFLRDDPQYRWYSRPVKISRSFTLLAGGVNVAESAGRLYDEPPTTPVLKNRPPNGTAFCLKPGPSSCRHNGRWICHEHCRSKPRRLFLCRETG